MNINTSHFKTFFGRFWKPILMLIAIVILCMMPSNKLPNSIPVIPHFDKIVHFGLYFSIMSLIINPLTLTFSEKRRAYFVGVLICFLLGVLIEFAQSMTATRSASGLDVMANTLGMLSAIACYPLFMRYAFFRRILNV